MASERTEIRLRRFLLGLVLLVIATVPTTIVASAGSDIGAAPDALTSSCKDVKPSGTILYLPGVESPGEPSRLVGAIDPTGKVLGTHIVADTITLTDVGNEEYALLVTEGTEYFVVDPSVASVSKLSFADDANKPIELRSLRPIGSKR